MALRKESVGASMGKASVTRGVNGWIEKHAKIQRNILMKLSPWMCVHSIFERNLKETCHGCMYAICCSRYTTSNMGIFRVYLCSMSRYIKGTVNEMVLVVLSRCITLQFLRLKNSDWCPVLATVAYLTYAFEHASTGVSTMGSSKGKFYFAAH